jgi:hypothetical protein
MRRGNEAFITQFLEGTNQGKGTRFISRSIVYSRQQVRMHIALQESQSPNPFFSAPS